MKVKVEIIIDEGRYFWKIDDRMIKWPTLDRWIEC